MQALLAAAALCSLLVGALCSSVVLVDTNDSSYLHNSAGADIEIDAQTFSSVLSALSGLSPAYQVDDAASQLIGQLVKPSAVKKPQAHVVLNVAGLSPEDVADLFGQKTQQVVRLTGEESTASLVANSLASIALANEDLDVVMLDHSALQGCVSNCIDEYLADAAQVVDASHSNSQLVFPSGASLDLNNLADKLFAVELASFFGGLKQELSKRTQEAQDYQILESTLLGLQGLAQTYGDNAEQVVAAKDAMMKMLKHAVDNLDHACNGDVTYQVAGFPGAAGKTTVKEIMGWKEDSRRRLQAASVRALAAEGSSSTWPPADEAEQAKKFSTKAAAYGSFIFLLYFSLAAVWCMCFMPMKKDTMLFGAKKTD